MNAESQRPNGRDGVISSLNMAIEVLNLAKEVSSITQAKAVLAPSAFFSMIIVRFPPSYDSGLGVHVYPGIDD